MFRQTDVFCYCGVTSLINSRYHLTYTELFLRDIITCSCENSDYLTGRHKEHDVIALTDKETLSCSACSFASRPYVG